MEVRSWSQLVDAILLRKVAFLVTFFITFLVSYSILAWLDFLPELVYKEEVIEINQELDNLQDSTSTLVISGSNDSNQEPQAEVVVLPLTMTIEALDRKVAVLNPTSREITDLDTALLNGVVRHPDSATLNQVGTVFILGHSSYLPVVYNKNFQAFNGIQDLKWGDTITINSEEGEYTYRVDKVYRAKASDVVVPIAGTEKRLVLATCNSFGSTDDRYIVEADLISESII